MSNISLMSIVAMGLRNPNAQCPNGKVNQLGDRSKYVGASTATGCLRKSYMDVKAPKESTDDQIFVFERGHQLEEMIRKGLNGAGFIEFNTFEEARKKNGKNLITQLEVCGSGEFSMLKAHIDFVFVKAKAKELIVAEIKSTDFLPDAAWGSHLLQIELQIWLLRQLYPEWNVRGILVYHSWGNGKNVEFAVEQSEMYKVGLERVNLFWEAIRNDSEPIAEVQLYCSACPHKESCPLLEFGANLPMELLPYVEKTQQAIAMEKEAKKIKSNMLALMAASGLKKAKIGNNYLEIVTVQGKKYVSVARLKKEHREVYNKLAEDVGGYTFLKIT